MDKIAKLRAFNTTVLEGSFTKAAEALAISPQLVSKYVGALENELAVRLFNRTTRKLTLTEAGSRYFAKSQSVLEQIEELDNSVTNFQAEVKGKLRINAPVTFSTQHLAPLLHAYQKKYPDVIIDLQLNDRQVDLVDEGFDLALRIGRLTESSMIAKRLAPIRVAWCASPNYLQRHGEPQSLEELEQHTVLHYSYASDKTINTSKGKETFICNNGEVIVKRAILGDGIVLKPTFMVGEALKTGQLKQILTTQAPSPAGLYAVYPNRHHLPAKVRTFIDFSADFFDGQPSWDAFEV